MKNTLYNLADRLEWHLAFPLVSTICLTAAALMFVTGPFNPDNRYQAKLHWKMPRAIWDTRKDPSMLRFRLLFMGYDPDDPDIAETIARGGWL